MSFLDAYFLWLLLPLMFFLWKNRLQLMLRVHLSIMFLLVLSLARPVLEGTLVQTDIEAKDVIIALDVSYSMRATDLAPTRYDFAKETIKAFLAQNPTDNIMLMAFTTNPLLLSPPTTDHALINIALESLNPDYILTKGTSLKTLFTTLEHLHLGHKNLIVMTDGGEENNLETLSRIVQESDLSLTLLALGSQQGTTIQNKEGVLLKDKEGNLVISRMNPLLESLCARVGATCLRAQSNPQSTADTLTSALQKQAREHHRVEKKQRRYTELYFIPLLCAIVLFMLLHTRGISYLILLFGLLGMPSNASVFDAYYLHHAYSLYDKQNYTKSIEMLQHIDSPSLQSQWALANSYYQQGYYKKAIALYGTIHSSSVAIKQQLYYNIATAYARLQAYDKAKIYYTKTLQLGRDEDALYNLGRIIFRSTKKDTLGMAHPKSQGGHSSKSTQQDKEERKKKPQEEQANSGAGGSGGKSTIPNNKKKITLLPQQQKQKHPLGSKVYDLINKGYIRETQPW